MDNIALNLGKGLHFVHLNVRSLLAKNCFDMLKSQIVDSNIDVFTISESWLSNKIPSTMITIPGYTTSRLDRPVGVKLRGGGGLVTYVNDNIYCYDSKFEHLNIMSFNIKIQCLELKIPNVRQIVVLNLYRPPQGSVATFLKKLGDTISNLKLNPNHELFVLGDFNINMSDNNSKNSKDLSQVLKMTGALPLIKEFSSRSENSRCSHQFFCKDINITKSSAVSLISSRILKDAFLVLTLQLVYLFNMSSSCNIFPPKWKEATVIPLFKGGTKTNVSNTRPICLLPLPGKILEKIVHNRLSLFMERNDLLYDEQNGF